MKIYCSLSLVFLNLIAFEKCCAGSFGYRNVSNLFTRVMSDFFFNSTLADQCETKSGENFKDFDLPVLDLYFCIELTYA